MEKKLFSKLQSEFPELEFIANDKIVLNGLELDIYIPSLRIGIEWNGIVHFKPIYGIDKLSAVQQRDKMKADAAITNKIDLIIVSDLVSNDSFLEQTFYEIAKYIRSRRDQCGI